MIQIISRRSLPAPTQVSSLFFPVLWSFLSLVINERAWSNEKCLANKYHQTLFGEQTSYRFDTLFGAVWSCLIVLNRVWSCMIKFEGHQTFDQKLQLFQSFVLVFDGWCFVRFGSRVSNMFDARMRTTLAQRLVSIVWSVFDETCFNRLATLFNISMFGHQAMFDGVSLPNISRLSRPLLIKYDPTRSNEVSKRENV